MFADHQRQKAYLWYARYSELKKIQFWQSVVDDVERLAFRRDPTQRIGRLTQELRQLERELGHDYLSGIAQQERWSGVLPAWMSAQTPPSPPRAMPAVVSPAASAPPPLPSAGRRRFCDHIRSCRAGT